MNTIRVCSFNVFNLVSPGFNFYRTGSAYSPAEFGEKVSWIGRQLDEMQVDLVGFQEVFHKNALKTALERSERFAGSDPIVLATNEIQDPLRSPAVGLATTLDIVGEPESVVAFPDDAIIKLPTNSDETDFATVPITTFSRPVLKVRVRFSDSVVVTVFVAHLKSKRPALTNREREADPRPAVFNTLGTARSLIRRAAEAAALRSLVITEAQNNDDPVIVIGDVNDGTLSVTTQMIAGDPPFFRLSAERKKPARDLLLYTAQQIQARESTRDTYFTHIFNGSYESLDQIMVSQEFYRRNPNRVGQVDYVQVFNDHILDEMQSFDEIPRTRSDHGQVVVKIRLTADST